MAEKMTDKEFLEHLRTFDTWNRRLLLATFALFGLPPSMLDIGSGTGAMVEVARSLHIEAVGVDRLAKSPNIKHDLKEPLNLGKTYVLITCLEVAEHIPEKDSGVFLNNVCSHLARGGRLIFSAAPQNQPGDGHVHLRPASYWRTRIDERGLGYDESMTVQLRHIWQCVPMPMQWLLGNVQVFVR